METDKSLAVFAGQFVPLKLTTDGGADFGKWRRKYPVKGAGIPIVYVVRADGKLLYGQVGAPAGASLQQVLYTALRQSGRSYSNAEVALLKKATAAG